MVNRIKSAAYVVFILLLPVLFFAADIWRGGVLLPLDLLSYLVPSSFSPFGGVRNPHISDLVSIYYPWIELFRSGSFPLWNPYSFCGSPLVANAQNGILFPLTWLYRLLPLGPASILTALVKMWFIGIFAFLFYRRAGFHQCSALLGSVAFMFCGHTIVWLGYPTSFPLMCLPFTMWSLEKLLSSSRLRAAVFVSVAFGLLFIGGQPQTGVLIGIAAAIYFAIRVRDRAGSRVRLTAVFAVSCLVGLCLAAPQLIPFSEYLRLSAAGRLRGTFGWKEYPWFTLVSWIVPRFFGDPRAGNFWGFSSLLGEAIYPGFIPVVFSTLGLIFARKNNWYKAVMGVFLFGLFGLYVQPLIRLYVAVPMLSNIDNNKLITLVVFGLISLAVCGSDALLNGAGAKRVFARWSVAALAWIVFAGCVFFYFRPAVSALHLFRFEMREFAHLAFFVLLGASLLWLMRVGRLKTLTGSWILVLVTAGDLFRIWAGYYPSFPAGHSLPRSEAVSFLQAHSEKSDRFVGLRAFLPPEISVLYRLQDARGYDGLTPYRHYRVLGKIDPDVHDLLRRLKQAQPDRGVWTGTTLFYRSLSRYLDSNDPETLDALRHVDYWSSDISKISQPSLISLLGVRYLLGPKGFRAVPEDYRLVHSSDADVWENKQALPRAFIAADPLIVDSDDAALATITSGSFDYRNTAVVTAGLGRSGAAEQNDGIPGALTAARITRYENARVEIAAESQRGGWLILSDLFYPGWHASCDGQPAAIFPGNYLFRAVRIPPGAHVVTFWYGPSSFRIGLLLAAFGAACLLAFWTVERRSAKSVTVASINKPQ